MKMEQLCAHRVGEVMFAVHSLLLRPGVDHDEASRARDPE